MDEASRLNIPAVFLGNVPHHELPRLYRAADCFVTMSLSETFGLTCLEAMMCGCPAVMPYCPVFDEIWDGKTPKAWRYAIHKENGVDLPGLSSAIAEGPRASPTLSILKSCAVAGTPYPKTSLARLAAGIHILIVLFALRQLSELAEDLFGLVDLNTFFSRHVPDVRWQKIWKCFPRFLKVHEFLASSKQNASHLEELATWDRVPVPTAAIRTALAEWIHASGVLVDELILHGDVPERRIHLQVQAAQLPLPEPWHSLEHSRHPMASAHSVASAQEVPVPLYTSVPTNTPSRSGWAGHNVGAQRAKGITTFDAVPLVVVGVQRPEEPSKLRWGVPILARFKIGKQPLVAAFGQAFASVDASTWSI
ncbi:unnamed protein product [Prorocentrum cordatum]|uniref:Glycosyl transferase family 1 domain-containing protein n=1 Tax=Prorocentrum cordatum TaxID=2364126 RepID=A0ABN9WVC2_9DINO|nr:unnamed protein product [Polarella glacialis]